MYTEKEKKAIILKEQGSVNVSGISLSDIYDIVDLVGLDQGNLYISGNSIRVYPEDIWKPGTIVKEVVATGVDRIVEIESYDKLRDSYTVIPLDDRERTPRRSAALTEIKGLEDGKEN